MAAGLLKGEEVRQKEEGKDSNRFSEIPLRSHHLRKKWGNVGAPNCTFHLHRKDILASIVCLGDWTWFTVKVTLKFRFGSGAGEGTISTKVFTVIKKHILHHFLDHQGEIRAPVPSNKWVSLQNYIETTIFCPRKTPHRSFLFLKLPKQHS